MRVFLVSAIRGTLVLSTVEHNYLVVDGCYLLHKYQLHVSAIMAMFRLNELTRKKAVIFGTRLIRIYDACQI